MEGEGTPRLAREKKRRLPPDKTICWLGRRGKWETLLSREGKKKRLKPFRWRRKRSFSALEEKGGNGG